MNTDNENYLKLNYYTFSLYLEMKYETFDMVDKNSIVNVFFF